MNWEEDVDLEEEICDTVFGGRKNGEVEGHHLKNVRDEFVKKLEALEKTEGDGVERKFGKSQFERVKIAHECFQWLPVPSSTLEKLGKNPKVSSILREKGNVLCKLNRYFDAIRGYNLAICFGRPGMEETGLAYANRAAIFLRLQEPELAVRDIGLAKANAFPPALLTRLGEREKKCEEMILEKKGEKVVAPAAGAAAGEKEDQDDNNANIFSLSKENEKIPGAEKVVEIAVSQVRGRFIRVREDVKAGSLLLREKPFATVLEKELVWDAEHCQICLKRILGGIPCDKCTFAMYCDEKCRLEAEEFHQFEHQVWAYLHGIETSNRDLLAVRIVGKCGLQGLFRLWKELRESESGGPATKEDDGDKIAGCNPQGVYDARSYASVYNLVGHGETLSWGENVTNCFKALVLAHLLRDMSTFFHSVAVGIESPDLIPLELKEEKSLVNYIAGVILHHMENIPFNAISLNELIRSGSPTGTEKVIKSVPYASAVFGLLSLCNHSCCPNALHVRRNGSQLTTLITMRNLKAGEEVCITYGPSFAVHQIRERQSILKRKYNFLCDCTACAEKWPGREDIATSTASFPPSRNSGEKEEEKKKKESGKKDIEKHLRDLYSLQQEHKFKESYQGIKKLLCKYSSDLPPHDPLILMGQDMLKIALINIVNDEIL